MSVTEGQIRGKYNQDTNVPRSNFTDFKIILQTCTGLDLFTRSCIWFSLHIRDVICFIYQVTLLNRCLHVHFIADWSFYACQLDALSSWKVRCILCYTQKRQGRRDGRPDRRWRSHWGQASTSPVATGAVTLMTFPHLCNGLFALYIFAPIVVY